MIPIEDLPFSTIINILQKMELKTWIRSRMTGSFLFDFILKNSRKFNFSCPLVNLVFLFGNFTFKCRVFLGDKTIFTKKDTEVVIIDPEVSLAGLRFNEMTFREMHAKWVDQTIEDYREYLQNSKHIILNLVLPLVELVKNRADFVVFAGRTEDIGRIVEASGRSKFFTIQQSLEHLQYPSWIDQPQLQKLTHMKISAVSDFGFVPQFIRRFEFFYANTVFRIPEIVDCQEEVKNILKNLAIGSRLPGPRSMVLKTQRDNQLEFHDGKEFEAVNHRILFNRKIKHSYYNVTAYLTVALLLEENFIGLVTVLHDDPVERFDYCRIQYRMELLPIFVPERIALFVLERAVALRPIDISGLFEKLEKKNDIGEVLTDFLLMCHSEN